MFLHDITMVSLSQYLTSEENWLLPPAASFDFFDADFRDVCICGYGVSNIRKPKKVLHLVRHFEGNLSTTCFKNK